MWLLAWATAAPPRPAYGSGSLPSERSWLTLLYASIAWGLTPLRCVGPNACRAQEFKDIYKYAYQFARSALDNPGQKSIDKETGKEMLRVRWGSRLLPVASLCGAPASY